MPADKSSIMLSAHSLQAFVDCERRFELLYLDRLKWPAVESEPVLQRERFLENGRRFHEMIERDLIGLDVPAPAGDADDEMVLWWNNYLAARPAGGPGVRFPEKTLVGTIGEHALTATYDLVVVTPEGTARIYDWKTWRKKHDRGWLAGRLQTRVYPYLLAQAGAALNDGRPISPDDIEMVYWYARFPDEPERFVYDATQFLEDHAYLLDLVNRIDETSPGAFPLTDELRQCALCVYRSYCGRGAEAGAFSPDEADVDPEPPALLGSLDDYEAIAF